MRSSVASVSRTRCARRASTSCRYRARIGSRIRPNAVTAAILREHPDLKAILASNDNMALGAASAIRQAGKTGQVSVVGFDNIAAIQQLIKEGRVLATADQHGDRLAVFGIEYALKILRGEAQPQDLQTPVDLVTASK